MSVSLSPKKALAKVKKAVIRGDSWMNILTSLGTTRDANTATEFVADDLLFPETLDALFTGNDFAKKIVSAKVDEAMRQGFCVEPPKGMEDDAISEKFEDALELWDVQAKVHEAAIWGRLFGGALVVFGFDGIQADPIDLQSMAPGSLRSIKVFDLRDITIRENYSDPTLANYGEPMIYEIRNSTSVFGGGGGIPVHETRCIRFPGDLTTRTTKRSNQGWDVSVLQAPYTVLRDSGNNWGSMCALIKDFGQGVFKIKGLFDMIVAGQEDKMRSRMEVVDYGRSVLRSLVLDTDEEDYERKATPVSGLDVLLDKTWQRLAAAADMPVTVLMGMSPAGLNATGESDTRHWYDKVAHYQRTVLKRRLKLVCDVVGRNEGIENAAQWEIEFPSLWQSSEKEKAEVEKLKSDRFKVDIDAGVLLAEEVAISRYGSNESDVKIDVGTRDKALKMALKEITNPKPEVDPNAPQPGDPNAEPVSGPRTPPQG